MAIKAVVFDLDDTLWHTFDDSYTKHCIAAEKFGINRPTKKRFKEHWGKPWKEFVELNWPGVDAVAFKRFYYEFFSGYTYRLVDGVLETIGFLKGKGIPLAVVTSRSSHSLPERALKSGLDVSVFEHIQTPDDSEFQKPHPLVFSKALERFSKRGIKPQEVLFVGDTLIDLEAAKNAGLHFAAVLTGIVKQKDFLKAGLDKRFILRSAAALPGLLSSGCFD
jgi:phosphoglycolate phosphatase